LSHWPSQSSFVSPLCGGLFDHLGNDPGTYCPATLANGEAKFFLHCDGLNQYHIHTHVVSRHHHLATLG